MLRFDDSMIDLHNFPSSNELIVRKNNFWFLVTGGGTFVNSFASPEKSLFCTDAVESIDWQDLEQRQRTSDCFVIHPPH